MVAYEPNAQETQYLQGWVMQDRFLMRHPFGAPYEFLWANPYHPGLTYHSLPLALHDKAAGRLFLRSSWQEEAEWLGCFDGSRQLLSQGQLLELAPGGSAPRRIGDAWVLVAGRSLHWEILAPAGPVFIVGLKPETCYDVEVDDEEMREECADRGGIMALPAGTHKGIRMRESRR